MARTRDDGIGATAFEGRFAGRINRQDQGVVRDGEGVTKLAGILARTRVTMRLENDDEATHMRLAYPLE